MKYCTRWSLRARIFDFEANFGALCAVSWYMACRDGYFLSQRQHGAKHSTLGSVQGVPVGGNPVVDRHVYFKRGF